MSVIRPEDVANKTLLCERNVATVWIVYDKVRYPFPNPEAFEYAGLKLEDVKEVSRGALMDIRLVPDDGKMIQEWRTGHAYVIARGRRLQITADQQDERGGVSATRGVPWATLDAISWAGRYRWWKRWWLIPISAFILRPRIQRFLGWFASAIVGGVSAGLIVFVLVGD